MEAGGGGRIGRGRERVNQCVPKTKNEKKKKNEKIKKSKIKRGSVEGTAGARQKSETGTEKSSLPKTELVE